MPGYSESEHIVTVASILSFGGGTPSTGGYADNFGWTISSITFTPTVSASYGVGLGVGTWSGSDYNQAYFPFAATVTKAIFDIADGSHLAAPGTEMRVTRGLASNVGLSHGSTVLATEWVMPAMPGSSTSGGNIIEVGFNGGAGIEVSPGELLFVYGKARADRQTQSALSSISSAPFTSGCASATVSFVYTTRETYPAAWAGKAGPFDKPVQGSFGKIYPVST